MLKEQTEILSMLQIQSSINLCWFTSQPSAYGSTTRIEASGHTYHPGRKWEKDVSSEDSWWVIERSMIWTCHHQYLASLKGLGDVWSHLWPPLSSVKLDFHVEPSLTRTSKPWDNVIPSAGWSSHQLPGKSVSKICPNSLKQKERGKMSKWKCTARFSSACTNPFTVSHALVRASSLYSSKRAMVSSIFPLSLMTVLCMVFKSFSFFSTLLSAYATPDILINILKRTWCGVGRKSLPINHM